MNCAAGFYRALGLGICLSVSAGALAGEAKQPATPGRTVQFGKDVLPIFAHRCFECHANGKRKGELDMSSRETLLKGGKDGAAIVVGNSSQSELIRRVTSKDDDERMPNKGEALAAEEIATL